MFKNYLKIAFRNLSRNKLFSFINLTGLAIGMTCFILMLMWVLDELSYEDFQENLDQVYRVYSVSHNQGEARKNTLSPYPLSHEFKETFPEVLDSARIEPERVMVVHRPPGKPGEEKSFWEDDFVFSDPSVFKILTMPFVQGNPETALSKPNTLVMTRSAARRYFGDENPLGKNVTVANVYYSGDYTVTGVVEDTPPNSRFHYPVIASYISFDGLNRRRMDNWSNVYCRTWLLMAEGTDIEAFERKASEFYNGKLEKQERSIKLEALRKAHLYGTDGKGDIQYVYIFSIIAVFIILFACINFMNLATAQSVRRAKEVGLRKVVGAFRRQIIQQFFGEAVLLSLLAFLATIVLVHLFLPILNDLAGKDMTLGLFDNFLIYVLFLAVALMTGVIAGSYPALYLSSFQPAKVLRGQFKSGTAGIFIRKALVVFQFCLSIILMICTIVIYSQLNYIQNKKTGLNLDNLIYVPAVGSFSQKYEAWKEEVKQHPGVVAVAASGHLQTNIRAHWNQQVSWEGKDPAMEVEFYTDPVDFDYISAMGIEMADGRTYSKEYSTDGRNFIVNEAAARFMGVERAVGTQFNMMRRRGKIIGVVKDFHFQPLQDTIKPFLFWVGVPRFYHFAYIRYEADKFQEVLEHARNAWNKANPGYPFEYHFLKDAFAGQYEKEYQTGKVIGVFSLLAIFISCLGLLGLAAFVAEQRTKEIGIRKVLGANVPGIVALLSKDFIKWVLTAFVIACPVAYVAMDRWLSDFAYRVELSVWIFALSAALSLVIAFVTVSFHTNKVANMNPVKTIGRE